MMVFVSALGNFARLLYLLRKFENVRIISTEARVGGWGWERNVVVVRGIALIFWSALRATLCRYVSYPTPTW